MKFKVGDEVIVRDKHDYNSPVIGEKYTITEIRDGSEYQYCINVSDEEICWMEEEWLELAVGEFKNKKEKTTMPKIKEYVKNLTLSADEKALRKVGFKDENGAFTSEAFDVIVEKLANDNIAYLVEIAKGIISEEKK